MDGSAPTLMEEVLVYEGSLKANTEGRTGSLRLERLLQQIYAPVHIICDCEGCEAAKKKALAERGGGGGANPLSCELQILVPPDDATIGAAQVAGKAAAKAKAKKEKEKLPRQTSAKKRQPPRHS